MDVDQTLICPFLETTDVFPAALSSLVSCLLLFTRHLDGSEPPRTLCDAQSALMLAQPPGMSAAALTVVWKVWSLTWSVRTNVVVSKEPFWLSCILLGSPYLIWGILAGAFAVAQTGSRVYRSSFYCTTDNQTLGIVSGALAAVMLISCLAFQTWTVILVYKRYRKSRRLGRAEVGDVSVPFLARIIAFMLFILAMLSFVATSTFALELPDIIIASIGCVIFIIFASQKDVLAAWGIVRPKSRCTDSEVVGTEGHDAHSTHTHNQIPPLTPFSPLSPIGMSLGPSQASSLCNIPAPQHELSPTKYRFDDIESVHTSSSRALYH
ncbi:hypothetical protein RhiJN_22255 [Ceratobasidium sp. AG-Ba]|nr:hypothetical protein RhiJN_22255 [Ceratobasidium sp. AG-Ba]